MKRILFGCVALGSLMTLSPFTSMALANPNYAPAPSGCMYVTIPPGINAYNVSLLCGSYSGNPGHPTSSQVLQSWVPSDVGGWLYHNDPADPMYGQFQANCGHQDVQGKGWLFQ